MPKLNVRLIRKVQKAILEEPRRFDIGGWGYFLDKEDRDETSPPCGTVACIAGWSAIIDHQTKNKVKKLTSRTIESVIRKLDKNDGAIKRGADLLGIEIRVAEELFLLSRWPQPYQRRYRLANQVSNHDAMAKAASDLLDKVVELKGEMPV